MTVIAHLSDLHFGAEDADVVAALRTELNAAPPDLVAISGDLTQGARRLEFRAAREFIDGLAAPVLAVPGNHDITPYDLRERFANPYGRWRDAIAPETEPVWRNSAVAVLGLNTAHRAGLHWDWSRGRVTPGRLRRLLDRLASLPPAVVRIVVAHHPLLAPEASPHAVVAGRAKAALAAFAEADVRLVLSGHVHRGYSRFGGGGAHRVLVLQAATATSVRLRGEPNAYNIVRVEADGGLTAETRTWDGAAWRARTVTTAQR